MNRVGTSRKGQVRTKKSDDKKISCSRTGNAPREWRIRDDYGNRHWFSRFSRPGSTCLCRTHSHHAPGLIGPLALTSPLPHCAIPIRSSASGRHPKHACTLPIRTLSPGKNPLGLIPRGPGRVSLCMLIRDPGFASSMTCHSLTEQFSKGNPMPSNHDEQDPHDSWCRSFAAGGNRVGGVLGHRSRTRGSRRRRHWYRG